MLGSVQRGVFCLVQKPSKQVPLFCLAGLCLADSLCYHPFQKVFLFLEQIQRQLTIFFDNILSFPENHKKKLLLNSSSQHNTELAPKESTAQ